MQMTCKFPRSGRGWLAKSTLGDFLPQGGTNRGVSPGEVPKVLAVMSQGNKGFLNTYCVLGM